VKLTGERPMEGATPDALLALHAAGYREVRDRLGAGRVLDLGCGTGLETDRFSAPDRYVVGVDYSVETMVEAAVEYPNLRFAGMDAARLGFADRSFQYICSSHIIEHFTNPERHVAELARVVDPDGSVFVITPNRPADFENPFHVYLFEEPELRSLLSLFFEDVEVVGLEGSPELHADFATRRASGERLLKLDVFGLRHRLPRSWYVWSYEHALPVVYRALGSGKTGIGSGLDETHLFIDETIEDTTPCLFATARSPRR
jgi:SAM-dependent methyltransferase